jgi:hypothetical protein
MMNAVRSTALGQLVEAHLPMPQASESQKPKWICDSSVTVGELARGVQAWPSSSLISSRRRRALTPAGQPA